jgi:hypothetical protein
MAMKMKRRVKLGTSAMAAVAWIRLLAAIAAPVEAIACCRDAQHDERNGFEFTAAMEWRNAAQHLEGIPWAPEFCWTQWERIMRLPRRLANPIVDDTSAPFLAERHAEVRGLLAAIPATQISFASVS